MTTKPKIGVTSKVNAASLRSQIFRPPQWIFDPVDMEHIFTVDVGLAKQLTAQRLETQAEVHRIVAEGSAKAAKMMR